MITGVLVDIVVTVLIYRWLFPGIHISARSRRDRICDYALRAGFAWVFPLFVIWVLYESGFKGVVCLFRNDEEEAAQ